MHQSPTTTVEVKEALMFRVLPNGWEDGRPIQAATSAACTSYAQPGRVPDEAAARHSGENGAAAPTPLTARRGQTAAVPINLFRAPGTVLDRGRTARGAVPVPAKRQASGTSFRRRQPLGGPVSLSAPSDCTLWTSHTFLGAVGKISTTSPVATRRHLALYFAFQFR